MFFGGNPAAVIALESWLPDKTLQSIALENNLSETAYFVRAGERYLLRWFTPTIEMDLCGHATLAAAHVLFQELGYAQDNKIYFDTTSGELVVKREADLMAMDFPSRPPKHQSRFPQPGLAAALGGKPREILASRDYFAVYDTEEEVLLLQPDMGALAGIDRAVIVTAKGKNCDFVSRFFAPSLGVMEDPVTGSAHSTLIPYWAEKLGKQSLHARQLSARGGELYSASSTATE